ncbi:MULTISPECIES: alpha/beta fold hydrolase [Eubacterium]|uniref:Pimeloyl-ACP methyl ester carboxylesterase n=1 Tax=Eubacterium barkeri TaxID=1528 RepID=A0A1H3AK51_EUBBA|nr:alpha/beta hydrolase [Eubacterium barkeri]SDX30090.1 Pimeloyl-ACP methyl ester carboxylesterase [Eubacterium barkeri]
MIKLAAGRFGKAKAIEGFANAGGVHIHYRMEGSGPAVLLLHGNGENMGIFEPHIAVLKDRFTVVCLDTRGHGRSESGEEPWSMALFAMDISRVMDALSIEKAAVVGFSDGGNIALQLAISCPQRVTAIVPVGANAWPLGLGPMAWLSIHLSYVGLCLAAPFSKDLAHKRRQYALMVKEPKLNRIALEGITAPTLIISGTKDIVTRRHTQTMATAIPGASLLYQEGARHDDFITHPEVYLPTIMDFLLRVGEGQKGA